jgi:hypothetical protein
LTVKGFAQQQTPGAVSRGFAEEARSRCTGSVTQRNYHNVTSEEYMIKGNERQQPEQPRFTSFTVHPIGPDDDVDALPIDWPSFPFELQVDYEDEETVFLYGAAARVWLTTWLAEPTREANEPVE